MAAFLEAKQQSNHDRMLRLGEVLHRTGMKRSWVYARLKSGEFPPAVKLGARAVAWSEQSIDSWIAQRIAKAARKEA